MLFEDIFVEFLDFEPSELELATVHRLVHDLHLCSPSQSYLYVSFVAKNGVYEGAIKVCSAALNINVNDHDMTVVGLGQKLIKKSKVFLKEWHLNRFANEKDRKRAA